MDCIIFNITVSQVVDMFEEMWADPTLGLTIQQRSLLGQLYAFQRFTEWGA